MIQSREAYWYAGLSVLLWSSVATAFKLALNQYNSLKVVFYASLFTLVFLLLILMVRQKVKLLWEQSVADWGRSALLGALNPVLYYWVLFGAYSRLPAQLAQPLNMVWPFALALLSVPLLGQRIGRRSFWGMAISFLGVVIISSQGGVAGFENTNLAGVLLALLSSVIWALYWIFNVRDRRDVLVRMFTNFLFGVLFLLPFVWKFQGFALHAGVGTYAIFHIGLFETGITYLLWMKAMNSSSNNAKVGNLVFLTPFISLIFIRLVLKENIYLTTFIGLLFIVSGIFFQQTGAKETKGVQR